MNRIFSESPTFGFNLVSHLAGVSLRAPFGVVFLVGGGGAFACPGEHKLPKCCPKLWRPSINQHGVVYHSFERPWGALHRRGRACPGAFARAPQDGQRHRPCGVVGLKLSWGFCDLSSAIRLDPPLRPLLECDFFATKGGKEKTSRWFDWNRQMENLLPCLGMLKYVLLRVGIEQGCLCSIATLSASSCL